MHYDKTTKEAMHRWKQWYGYTWPTDVDSEKQQKAEQTVRLRFTRSKKRQSYLKAGRRGGQ